MKFLRKISQLFRRGERDCVSRDNIGRNVRLLVRRRRKYKKCHLEEDERKLRSKFTAACGRPEAHHKLSSAQSSVSVVPHVLYLPENPSTP